MNDAGKRMALVTCVTHKIVERESVLNNINLLAWKQKQ